MLGDLQLWSTHPGSERDTWAAHRAHKDVFKSHSHFTFHMSSIRITQPRWFLFNCRAKELWWTLGPRHADEKFGNDQQTQWQMGKMSLSVQPHVSCGPLDFLHMFTSLFLCGFLDVWLRSERWFVFLLNEDMQIDKSMKQITSVPQSSWNLRPFSIFLCPQSV